MVSLEKPLAERHTRSKERLADLLEKDAVLFGPFHFFAAMNPCLWWSGKDQVLGSCLLCTSVPGSRKREVLQSYRYFCLVWQTQESCWWWWWCFVCFDIFFRVSSHNCMIFMCRQTWIPPDYWLIIGHIWRYAKIFLIKYFSSLHSLKFHPRSFFKVECLISFP